MSETAVVHSRCQMCNQPVDREALGSTNTGAGLICAGCTDDFERAYSDDYYWCLVSERSQEDLSQCELCSEPVNLEDRKSHINIASRWMICADCVAEITVQLFEVNRERQAAAALRSSR